MTRRLNKSVLAGGVVYPAGTPATPELAEAVVNPDHWDSDGTVDADVASTALTVRGDLRDAIERIATRHLEDPTLAVADLLRTQLDDGQQPDERVERALALLSAVEALGANAAVEIADVRIEACDEDGQTATTRLLAELQAGNSGPNGDTEQALRPATGDGLTGNYSEAGVTALKAEVDRRNADRDPDGETYLNVTDRRSKDQLVVALQADDAAREG